MDNLKNKNLKAIYEQRRDKIQVELEQFNQVESAVTHYLNMKKHYGIIEGISVAIMSYLISNQYITNLFASILLSSSIGFMYISIHNAVKYKKMSDIRNKYPLIDFDNFDFKSNLLKKAKIHEEMLKIDSELENIKTEIHISNNYEVINMDDEIINIYDQNYENYEIYNGSNYYDEIVDYECEEENNYVLVKKLERNRYDTKA